MDSINDLYDPNLLMRILQGEAEDSVEKKPKDLIYAIYARKSREEDDRQIRSISDQISECQRIADQLGLKTTKEPFTEAVSAKESDNRREFSRMLNQLQKGEIDGVISWHPDRLSRNMKEAGMIIDFLDRGIIKDLKFASFTFENTTMGKVMLTIAFAISKQYSDKLSEDVKRGTRKIAEEGKRINRSKPGYFKDENRYLRPDGRNYDLIVEVFRMKLRGQSQKDIRVYLDSQGFMKRDYESDSPKIVKITDTKISRILRDPFYAGILRTGENLVNLCDIYDFKPAVSVADFLEINKFNAIDKVFKNRNISPSQNTEAKLLNKMVICGHCNENFIASITHKISKKGKEDWYYYFRCDTPGCKFKNKSVRAKVVINYACDYLRGLSYENPELFRRYEEELKRVNQKKIESLKEEKTQATRRLTGIIEKIKKIKSYLISATDDSTKSIFESDLRDELKNQKNEEEKVAQLDKFIQSGKTAPLSHQQFIELMNELPDTIANSKDMDAIDYNIRKIFLNFVVKDKKVLMHSLQSPFREYVENGIISNCRGAEN